MKRCGAMSALIVVIPLFDSSMTVKSYRLCGHNSEIALDIRGDFREKSQVYYMPGLELAQTLGLETFSGDMPIFVDVNRFHILNGMFANKSIPPDKLILTIPANIEADAKLLIGIEHLKELGYSIAIDGYPQHGLNSHLIGTTDHIMLSFRDKKFSQQFQEVKKNLKKVQLIISNLPTMEDYNKYSSNEQALFTGDFYNHPVTSGNAEISPIKANAIRLLKEMNQDDFELKNIAGIIERDPALSISLLRFINSPAVGLKSKVDSINSAVAILGQREVHHWATIAISVDMFQDRPGEIIRISLVRAKFAENLTLLFEMGAFQHSLFMAGLFSLLDLILNKPMEEAIKEVAVDNLVREALVERTGVLYRVLDFMYAYERADWNKVSIIMIQNDIKGELVGKAFVDALVWYNQLLGSIDSYSEDGAEPLEKEGAAV